MKQSRETKVGSDLRDAPAPAREPIAIVGIGCRYPGANSAEALWDMLVGERNGIREVPKERFDIDRFYDPRPMTPGKSSTRFGGFLDDVYGFDAEYFRISPREAARMDPQQRLMLEVAADALDDASLGKGELAQHVTGVYVGCWASDWEGHEYADRKHTDVYSMAGSGRCLISGRVSFAFDLRGPSLTVDTGCSASLIATHLACQSLWLGECSLALVGGANLILDPKQTITLSQGGMMAADGQCKAFDERADGFVRSDGSGAVVLMPLSKARARGARIYAVIRGSGASNDGFSNGLLATPSEIGQELAMRAAYASAGLSPNDVHYVEAHGTGTRAGDPVELRALGAVMRDRPRAEPCLVGSIKTNIGHTEGASGIAGLIKASLALHHRTIPRSLHCETPTPLVDWSELNLRVATETVPFPPGTARAAVSSFGISGTDVHVVLEEEPHEEHESHEPTDSRDELLVLSAMSAPALVASASAHAALLARSASETGTLRDICYSAALGRSFHDHRLAVVGLQRGDLAEALTAFARGEQHPGLFSAKPGASSDRPVFVFSGQGSQWRGMGRRLLDQETVFRASIVASDVAIRTHARWSLLDELHDESDTVRRIDIIQPSIFAVQVALAALWRSWGVEPSVVIGHSMGEVAAAHVAGALSLDDAARIICRRSEVLERLRGQGGMLSVELGFVDASALVAKYVGKVSVAASNGTETSVLSGDLESLAELAADLQKREIFAREVQVDAAAHSPQLDPQMPTLALQLAGITPISSAPVALYSTVTGAPISAAELDVPYWVRNMREPVRFATTLQTLIAEGHTTFLELSPHPILLGPIQQILEHEGKVGSTVSSLRRDEPERAVLLRSLGQLHALGKPVSLGALYPDQTRFVSLPRYPFQRDVYDELPGFDVNLGPRSTSDAAEAVDACVLGEPVRAAAHPKTVLWQLPLNLESSSFLSDHAVQSAVLLPGTAYVDLALQAARHTFGDRPHAVEKIEFATALVLRAAQTTVLQVSLSRDQPGLATVRFHSITHASEPDSAPTFTLHATAEARLLDTTPTLPSDLDVARVRERCEPVERALHFASTEQRGIHYGPAFQGITACWMGEREALASIALPASVRFEPGAYLAHPALLDACWQAGAACVFANTPGDALYLPVDVSSAVVFGEPVGTEVWTHVVFTTPPHGEQVRMDVRVYDRDGRPLLETTGMCLRLMSTEQTDIERSLYAMSWATRPAAQAPTSSLANQTWLVLADRNRQVGTRAASLLEQRGARALVVYPRDESWAPRDGDDARSVLPNSKVELAELVHSAASDAERPLSGVLDLWSLDAVSTELADPTSLWRAQQLGVVALTHLVQGISEAGLTRPKLWVVTAGAQPVLEGEPVEVAQAPVWALARVLRYEFPELRIHTLDLSVSASDTELRGLIQELCRDGDDDHLALRGEQRLGMQLVRSSADGSLRRAAFDDARRASWAGTVPPFLLTTETPGILDNLTLRETERVPPGAGEVEIEVVAAALNFIDVMKALGIYPGMGEGPLSFGGECAGRVTSVGAGVHDLTVGQRVVALADGSHGCFARYVVTRRELARPCPARLELAQAATVPAVFLTAAYALEYLGRLSAGERVLIHSATGGVGLAAIQLARRTGAVVFATAGSPEKRAFLHNMGIAHVYDSRSLRFAEEILRDTAGEGVDVVLNSLAGEAIPASLSLLRQDGRFLEIGKRDIYEDMSLGLLPFKRGLSFSHIDIARLTLDRPAQMGAMLGALLDAFADGSLAPLPHTSFPVSHAADAFRHMAQAKHIGKVVLSSFDDPALTSAVSPIHAEPLARPDATYLITGGLGGLGLLLAEFLASQRARHLVLLGRSQPSARALEVIGSLRARGVTVQVRACDVSDPTEVEQTIAFITNDMPPLRGIVHGAAVLDDGVALQLDEARFVRAMAPKLMGSWNLHAATAALPLDFFVLFSSAASALGSPGQGNYAAGNEFMDALAHYRRARGLPALSINWGPWRESGIAVGPDRAGRLAARGMGSVSDREGLVVLERLMRSDRTQSVVLPSADFRKWVEFYPAGTTSLLEQVLREQPAREGGESSAASARLAILGDDRTEHPARMEAYLVHAIRQVLRIPTSKQLDLDLPLNRFGIDSLMAVELKNRVKADLGVTLPVSKILLATGLGKLARDLLELADASEPASDAEASAGPATLEKVMTDLHQLEDDAAEAAVEELLDFDTGALA